MVLAFCASTRKRFDWADTLTQQIRAYSLPTPTREHKFSADRRWRFDISWPDRLIFIECDGGEFVRGLRRHGGAKDCEKFNAAVLAGWTGFRFVGSQIKSGYAIDLLRQVLG